MKKLKEFGADSMATDNGYDLELLVSWIENLVQEEGDKNLSKRGQERLSKAENALQLLTEVLEY
jgi:hypothetical protein